MEEKVFYLDNQKRIITGITIINTKVVSQSSIFKSEYILYIIKITSPFNSWIIKKRYTEIQEIYNFLVKKKPKLSFPEFPPKRLFSTKEATIIERKNRFEEIFHFILKNVEILRYNKLIDFFNIKKTLLVIYIKNCILVNENRLNYEVIDDNNSSSSSNELANISNSSDKEKSKEKDKKNDDSIKVKIIRNNKKEEKNKNKDKEDIEFNNKINDKTKDNSNNNINDIINGINSINEDDKTENIKSSMNIKKIIKSHTNYFKCYEEFKLFSGQYTSRSQVSFFIIKELLRNLKVHSSHIFEIINDFSAYIKLKNKWKKFNEKEITSLFIGINKDELFEDYYQYILKEEELNNKYSSSSSLSEKSTLSSTGHSLNISNSASNIDIVNNKKISNIENDNIKDEKIGKTTNCDLEGLLYYIGNFEQNHIGARSILLFINKIFERDFNPEVDLYIKLFKKIDIDYIKKMNICKFSSVNNCTNQKLCFNLLNNYVGGYTEKKQLKIMKEIKADPTFINKFLESKLIDNSTNNPYNLE